MQTHKMYKSQILSSQLGVDIKSITD